VTFQPCVCCARLRTLRQAGKRTTLRVTLHMLFSFFSFDFLRFIFIEPVNSGTLLVVTEVLGEFWRDLTCRTWPCDAQTESGEAV